MTTNGLSRFDKLLLKLDEFEAQLEAMIERGAESIFRTSIQPSMYSEHLKNTVRTRALQTMDFFETAPATYYLVFSPSDLPDPSQGDRLKKHLHDALVSAATQSGLTFSSDPQIILRSSSTLKKGEIEFSFDDPTPNYAETKDLAIIPKSENRIKDHSAYLILPDNSIAAILSPATNIGRGSGNDIRFDEPQVSRKQAQIRNNENHFTLVDLDSKSGTFLNGARIQKATLTEGDVISFGGIKIVFGNEKPVAGGSTRPVQMNWDKAATD